MYTQICDENALIWGFPRRMFWPPPTWNFDDINNQYSYVNGAKRNSRCVADSKLAQGHKNYRICHIRKELIHGSRRFVYI